MASAWFNGGWQRGGRGDEGCLSSSSIAEINYIALALVPVQGTANMGTLHPRSAWLKCDLLEMWFKARSIEKSPCIIDHSKDDDAT